MTEKFVQSCFLCLCVVSVLVIWGECAVPEHISSFDNERVCDSNVRLVRPRSVQDVVEAVKRHSRVQATGKAHSWNNFFCAPPPHRSGEDYSTSANIAMTTIRPLTIEVDETDMSAWVSAGVEVWDLMVYLGNYVTPSAPRGYALLAPSQFVNQTIAGAIATGTHGSSLKYGSMSNQVTGFRVVLANGTLTEIDPENHPLFFKAFQVSVGRLGIVVEVKLKIRRESLDKKTVIFGIPREEFLARLKDAQEMYKSTGELPSWTNGVLFTWSSTDSSFGVHTFEEGEPENALSEVDEEFIKFTEQSRAFIEGLDAEKINAPVNLTRYEAGKEVADGVGWEIPSRLPPVLALKDPSVTAPNIEGFVNTFNLLVGNGTFETHVTQFTLPIPFIEAASLAAGDDHEVAIPVDKMADCIEAVTSFLGSMSPDNGLRGMTTLRFVGKEDGLLSVSNDKPHLYFCNLDLVYHNQEPRSSNIPFQRFKAFILTSPLCSPVRIHWGKAGWPDPGCWNGAEVFEETWCDFGCAVLALDPFDKFIGARPDLWNWNGANLDMCCTNAGYDYSLTGCGCDVVPIRTPEECPEAPFYTDR